MACEVIYIRTTLSFLLSVARRRCSILEHRCRGHDDLELIPKSTCVMVSRLSPSTALAGRPSQDLLSELPLALATFAITSLPRPRGGVLFVFQVSPCACVWMRGGLLRRHPHPRPPPQPHPFVAAHPSASGHRRAKKYHL